MKRILALVLVLAMICAIALTIVSCGVEATCIGCGEKFNANPDEVEEVLGENYGVCPKCEAELKDLMD